jgi:hypothetical protein
MEIRLNDEAFGNLQELTIEETQTVSGGWAWLVRIVAAIIVNAVGGVRTAEAPGLPDGGGGEIGTPDLGPVLHPCDAV